MYQAGGVSVRNGGLLEGFGVAFVFGLGFRVRGGGF